MDSKNTAHQFRRHKDRLGVCIDWETSGSDWDGASHETYQGVSYGIVVFDLNTFDVVDGDYVEIKFDESKYKWSTEAEKIHGLSREYLEEHGITQDQAAARMATMILKHFGPEAHVIFLGHNRQFDVDFTKQLLDPHGLMFKINNTYLDSSGVSFLTFGYHRSDDLFEAANLPPREAHNALEDAIYTVLAMKRVNEIFKKGLRAEQQ